MSQLVYNATKCLECGNTIVSYYTHDYKTCGCPNHAMVDGGLDYGRYGAANMSKIERIEVYDDEPFEKVRQYAYRGGRGKDGTESLTYTPICDMNDEWLKAILEYGGAEWHLNLIRKEIEYRKKQPAVVNKTRNVGTSFDHLKPSIPTDEEIKKKAAKNSSSYRAKAAAIISYTEGYKQALKDLGYE